MKLGNWLISAKKKVPGNRDFFIEVLYIDLEFWYNVIVNKTTDKQGGNQNDE